MCLLSFSLNFLMFCHPDSLMYCTWTQEKWRKKNSKIEKDKTTQVFYLTMNIVWSEKGMDIISVVLSVFLWAVTALQILHVNLIQILKVAIMQIQLDECSVEWASGVAECDYPLLSNTHYLKFFYSPVSRLSSKSVVFLNYKIIFSELSCFFYSNVWLKKHFQNVNACRLHPKSRSQSHSLFTVTALTIDCCWKCWNFFSSMFPSRLWDASSWCGLSIQSCCVGQHSPAVWANTVLQYGAAQSCSVGQHSPAVWGSTDLQCGPLVL